MRELVRACICLLIVGGFTASTLLAQSPTLAQHCIFKSSSDCTGTASITCSYTIREPCNNEDGQPRLLSEKDQDKMLVNTRKEINDFKFQNVGLPFGSDHICFCGFSPGSPPKTCETILKKNSTGNTLTWEDVKLNCDEIGQSGYGKWSITVTWDCMVQPASTPTSEPTAIASPTPTPKESANSAAVIGMATSE